MTSCNGLLMAGSHIKKICEVCGHQFILQENDIKKYKIENNNKLYNAVVMVCPSCKAVYLVQADDDKSGAVLDEIKRLFAGHAKLPKKQYKNVKQKLNKLEKTLKNQRLRILERLEGRDLVLMDTDTGAAEITLMGARVDYGFIK